MKKFAALLLPLAVAATFAPATIAQEKTALVPLPSLDDFTKGQDGWALGLGAGVEYESAYEGSDVSVTRTTHRPSNCRQGGSVLLRCRSINA